MKAVLFAGILLLVVGCGTVAASEPTPAPAVISDTDAALRKCIYAIIRRIENSDYGLSTDRIGECDNFRPPRPPGSSPYFAP